MVEEVFLSDVKGALFLTLSSEYYNLGLIVPPPPFSRQIIARHAQQSNHNEETLKSVLQREHILFAKKSCIKVQAYASILTP